MTTQTGNSTALAQAKANGLAAFTAKSNPFLAAASKEGVSDGLYLRLNGKTGKFVSNYPDISEFDPGTELVFDLFNAEALWQGFDKENKPYNGPKVTIVSGAELPPHQEIAGVKWTKQIRVMVAQTSGGKQMAFTAKADNPFRAIWKLVKKYGEQLVRNPDPTSKTGYMSPIVQIKSLERNTKKKEEKVRVNPQTGQREIYEEESPVQYFVEEFEIVDWISQAEMEEIMEASGEAALAGVAPAPQAQITQQQTVAQVQPQVAVQQTVASVAPVAPAAGAQPVLNGEILPPQGQPVQPAGASSFRRNRAGVRNA